MRRSDAEIAALARDEIDRLTAERADSKMTCAVP